MKINKIHKAACHSKASQFELHLPNGLDNPRRCDCSMCRMVGAIAASVSLEGLKIIFGEDKLTLYQFNTASANYADQ